MTNRDTLSSEAHLAAGGLALEQLRRQFIAYLDRKEREVLARQAAGEAGQVGGGAEAGRVTGVGGDALSEWL